LVTFVVPNEGKRPIDGVSIGLESLKLDAAELEPGWTHRLGNGRFLNFRGGSIRPGEFERFTLSLTIPERLRTYEFAVLQVSDGRIVGEFHPRIAIGPARQPSGRDSSSRELAKWALFLALGGWLKRA
jgi:hypothetical protein